jgi:hypothetical protein
MRSYLLIRTMPVKCEVEYGNAITRWAAFASTISPPGLKCQHYTKACLGCALWRDTKTLTLLNLFSHYFATPDPLHVPSL